MNPAFGAAQIRELTDIFIEKSIELRDAWELEAHKEGSDSQPATIDVLSWLSRMTLDVIGLAGTFLAMLPRTLTSDDNPAVH